MLHGGIIHVSVGDNDTLDTPLRGSLCAVDHVFIEHGGFIVCEGEKSGILPECGFGNRLGGFQGDGYLFRVGLRDIPVLAEFTVQIASDCSEGVGFCAGIYMEQGLLFDRIEMYCARAVINNGKVTTVTIDADTAIAVPAMRDLAIARAKLTNDGMVMILCIKQRLLGWM